MAGDGGVKPSGERAAGAYRPCAGWRRPTGDWLAYLGLGRAKYVNVCNLWDSRKRFARAAGPVARVR
jgi:hypothetical protein